MQYIKKALILLPNNTPATPHKRPAIIANKINKIEQTIGDHTS